MKHDIQRGEKKICTLFAIKMASSKETYCLCGQPYNVGQFMIECDCCREWFHGSCVDVKIYQSDDIDKYHCPKCSQTYGPSVLKIHTNNHRADRYELGAESKATQIGSPAWVRSLAARAMRPVPAALQRMRAHQFTEEFVRDNEFTRPILFHTPEGLDMQMPNPATFTVRSVLRYCGAQLEVEVIDVRKQSTLRMPLCDFVDYFETPPEQRDEKVLNVLSLEFSDTSMARLVEPPLMARRLDWAERVWPAAERPPRPAVQRYCLISAAGSYTDFHVDFGGTTVWYHVLHGRKIFYLVPPTAANLALYQQWSATNRHHDKFFGDLVEWYGTAELLPGQTLFIPTGWIHAVLTPEDSLVFGGNFLHSYAIEMQLQIYEIERKVETPIMLRYPLFESMHWYAGAHLLTLLRRHNEESQDEDFIINESQHKYPAQDLPPLLVRGIKILTNALKEWHALKSSDPQKRDNIPKCLNSVQLVRELCRELRTLEKRTPSSSNKDKDYKPKNHSPSKSHSKKHNSHSTKKLPKLTLPKPIMHMVLNNEFKDEKHNKEMYQETKLYNEKDIVYQNDRDYVTQEVKTYNGMQEKLYIDSKEGILNDKGYTYNYEDQYVQETNGYTDRHGKKNSSVLRIKLNNSPSSSRDDIAPPPYSLPEHSILKSHLIGRPVHSTTERPPALKPIHQWTISKKDMIGDCQEEQILFTNDNLQPNVRIDGQEMNYGPGMYSAEDIQPDYQYSETAKPGSYQPDYSNYQNNIQSQEIGMSYVDPNGYVQTRQREVFNVYDQKFEIGTTVVTQELTTVNPMGQISTGYVNTIQETVNGAYHELPSYDTAVAQQYGAAGYVIEEEEAKPKASDDPPTPVRRSERPVRRRVSPTYDYEDGDLYIDEAPVPARRRRSAPSKHKQYKQAPVPAVAPVANNYRQPTVARPAPANGIESLIQASVLAEAPEPVHSTEDAAVAGMLSISERYSASQQSVTQRTFGLASDNAHAAPATSATPEPSNDSSPSKRARKRAVPSSVDDDYDNDEDVIKEVHRDEEYVYPSLEMSSDEDEDWPPATRRTRSNRHQRSDKSKSDRDESWSPRARLGRLVPRLRGPARAGVRRECVRAALQAAAAAAPHAPAPAAHALPLNAKRAVLAMKSRRPPPPAQPVTLNKNSRLKKGMKTAKQRLGKILKLHKMIY